ncbi:ABC transporter permease [Phenylobacterium sp.]|jgi:ABC-2 type transport system permease protein|uniref:ABC transporter permease n=1 Tax=Phenylobacterium sp. TaxID=1871053 RepID=UPI0035B35532
MDRAALIAWREIKAYAGTLSFWLALVAGPVLMILAGLMVGPMMSVRPAERLVAISAPDPQLRRIAGESLAEAAQLDGRPLRIVAPGEAQTRLAVAAGRNGAVVVDSQGAPLSRLAWALLRRDLAGEGKGTVTLRQAPPPRAGAADHLQAGAGRFALVVLLWMNLVGALGMLLQAIVRERANRALEILLTSARPLEILAGKLAGVAALSVVVVAGWMAIGAVVAAASGAMSGRGAGPILAAALGDPARMVLAATTYALAFAMYGGAILGLSALSKDMPAAQNASRPVFGLLLLAFFAAIGMISGPGQFGWLLWVPPLTPFVLLMQDPAELGALRVAAALALMAASSAGVFLLAARSVGARPAWRGAFVRKHRAEPERLSLG